MEDSGGVGVEGGGGVEWGGGRETLGIGVRKGGGERMSDRIGGRRKDWEGRIREGKEMKEWGKVENGIGGG